MMMISLKRLLKNWGVVQLAERVAVNHEVAGSSPAAPAKHKGEEMSTSETKALKEELAKVRRRVNELVDDLAVVQSDIKRFKEQVASDVTYLTEQVKALGR